MKKIVLISFALGVVGLTGCASKDNMDIIRESEGAGVVINDTAPPVVIGSISYEDEKNKIFNEDGYKSIDDVNISNDEKMYVLSNNVIHFSFDSYELNEESKKNIKKHIETLSKYNNIKIIIEGHTDQRGDKAYNLVLGEKRAKAVKDYILSNSSVQEDRLEIISYGETKLLTEENNEAAWAENRRSVFVYN